MAKVRETKEAIIKKYDLACGNNKMADFIGVDIAKEGTQADVICDLEEYPWNFAKPDTVDEINCSHYIEHTEDMIKFMDECHRILKVGGKLTIVAPYYNSIRAWQDPTHKRAISEASFIYFNKAWREANKLEHYGIKSDFDFSYAYNMDNMWASRSQEARDFAVKHYTNVVSDIFVTLIKRGQA